jgi:hypothetical protein
MSMVGSTRDGGVNGRMGPGPVNAPGAAEHPRIDILHR